MGGVVMADWEFLLQKEGDRSWLPLDTTNVEILEGRYRIIARSARLDTPVAIRINHLALEEHPPKRRTQTRSGQTNNDGLMVVIPFTHLSPGVWEIDCAEAGNGQPSWHYSIQLQVLVNDEHSDFWEPDWDKASDRDHNSRHQQDESAATAATPPTNPFLHASVERLLQLSNKLPDGPVDDRVGDDQTPSEVPNHRLSAQNPHPSQAPIDADGEVSSTIAEPASISRPTAHTPWVLPAGAIAQISLSSTHLVVSPQHTASLQGQVQVSAPAATPKLAEPIPDPWDADIAPVTATASQLVGVEMTLRDPQTLQVLVSDRQPLPQTVPPFPFTFSFQLPNSINTHLVLGEVVIWGTTPTEPEPVVLTSQPFTVTVNPKELTQQLAQLQSVIAQGIATTDQDELPLRLAQQMARANTVDLSFLNLANGQPLQPSAIARHSQHSQRPDLELSFLATSFSPISDLEPVTRPSPAGHPLPPQIYQPDPDQAKQRPIDLPMFGLARTTGESLLRSSQSSASAAPPPALAANPANAETPTSDATVEIALEQPVDAAVAAPGYTSTMPEPAATNPDISAEALLPDALTESPEVVPPPFDLPSPTQMAFQALKLQERFFNRLSTLANPAQTEPPSASDLALENPFETIATPVEEPDYLSQEIVVEDEDPLPRVPSTPQPEATADNPLILPADQAVPVPLLSIPAGELVSGQTIHLRARIPNLLPCIYIKFWITDRETRSLLDGPHWLTELIPNGYGELEAFTHLVVPAGSLEIRFEAIAVEMATQRESHKASLERKVIPPDLPSLSAEPWDI